VALAAILKRFVPQSIITPKRVFTAAWFAFHCRRGGEARDRWLTRNEAAALIRHRWRQREEQTIHIGAAKGGWC
jgi:hypothetical protein